MLTTNVDTVERKLNGITGGSVILKCKDFRVIQLDISPLESFNNVATAIETLSSFGKFGNLIRYYCILILTVCNICSLEQLQNNKLMYSNESHCTILTQMVFNINSLYNFGIRLVLSWNSWLKIKVFSEIVNILPLY